MEHFMEPFLLGLTLHAGLLLNAIYQNAFILSRALTGKPMFGVVFIFILSSIVASILGIYALGSLVSDNEMFIKILSIIGASILLYQSVKAFKYARSHHNYDAKSGGIFIALTMVWLTPHIYVDMLLVSSVVINKPSSYYIPFIIGFSSMAGIWFSALAFFSSKASYLFSNNKIHTALHYASAIILGLISLAIALEVILDVGHTH